MSSNEKTSATEPDQDYGYFDVMTFLEGLSRDTSNKPQFLDRLGEEIERVVTAMRDVALHKGGEASGKVTVEFSLDLEGSQVIVTPKISTKSPSVTLNKSTAYIGPGGRLVEHDPRQVRVQFVGGGISNQPLVKGPASASVESKGGATGAELKAPSK